MVGRRKALRPRATGGLQTQANPLLRQRALSGRLGRVGQPGAMGDGMATGPHSAEGGRSRSRCFRSHVSWRGREGWGAQLVGEIEEVVRVLVRVRGAHWGSHLESPGGFEFEGFSSSLG